jgi:ADP-ribosylglycohydrolase
MKISLDTLQECLMGGAAGDCIGVPYEGAKTVEDPKVPSGRWRISDDTVLSLATCRAIHDSGTVNPEAIAQEFLAEYGRGIAGLGSSTLKAFRDLKAGAHWSIAGRTGEYAAGNGAAMRIAPLAFFLDAEDSTDRRVVRDVCRITHHNDEAYVGALAVVCTMQTLCGGDPTDAKGVLDYVVTTLPDTKVRDVLRHVSRLAPIRNLQEVAAYTGVSGYVAASVPLSIYIAAVHDDATEAILGAVGCGGDTDTIASMVGQIMGAKGHTIPHDWQEKIPCRDEIAELVSNLRAAHG